MTFDPKISVTIMYAPWEAWRSEVAERLYQQLSESACIESVSKHANSKDRLIWEDARECWLAGVEAGATHHLVLQDDVELCENFGEAAYRALQAVPNRPVSFYGTHKRIREAFENGHRWIRYNGGFWGQAPCLPTMWIEEAVQFGDTYAKPEFQADDCRLSLWAELSLHCNTWVTTPQLVEHLGNEDSARGSMPPSDWTAALFVGDTEYDPTAIDWKRGLRDVPMASRPLQIQRRPEKFRLDKLEADGYIESTTKP